MPEKSHGLQSRHVAIALATLTLLATAGWLAYKKWHANVPTQPVQRALTRPTSDEGLQTGATLSPDGRFIAYSSDRGGKYDIWIQQISGGDPIQITKGTDQNWQPDWSPDGKYIAYRSEEGEGGIYITPALGGAGQQRKITSFGYYPHWSPDSSRILFQPGLGLLGKNLYIVALDGNPPREVMTDHPPTIISTFSAWHPDGKRITTWILDNATTFGLPASPNFSTEPLTEAQRSNRGFRPNSRSKSKRLRPHPASLSGEQTSGSPGRHLAKQFTSSAPFAGQEMSGAWLSTPSRCRQATKVERLTTSPGLDAELSISPDGSKIAFTSEHQQVRAWAFPFDANHGRVMGPGQPVTSAGIEAWSLNLSRDGRKLASSGNHDGQLRMWETSLPSGREEPMVAGDSYHRSAPVWSPDGKRAAYGRWQTTSDKNPIVVWSSDHRNEDPIQAGNLAFAFVFDWSPDGKSVLVSGKKNALSDRPSIWQIFVDPSLSGKSFEREITSDPNYDLWQAHFSPDGQWVIFEATKDLLNSTIYVVPAAGGQWIRITDGKQWDDKPRWSPDGKTIYYLSERRSFFNVWGVHFDPVKGQPQGKPFQVTQFETPTQMIPKYIPSVGFSLAEGRLVLPIAQVSGNIWILDNVDR